MKLSCIIIDDEYLAIKLLEEYTNRHERITLQQTFKDPRLALQHLREKGADLLLLDIQMPFLNGFELLSQLTDPPLVVFTTARHDFAVQAFELDVVDYLVKPIAWERFDKAINRAAEFQEYRRIMAGKEQNNKNYLMVRSGYRIVRIDHASILFIEGLNEYVKVYTSDKVHVTLAALKDLSETLPANDFVRIHKSYIVSIPHIVSWTTQSVTLKSNKQLPIGRVYKEGFLSRLK